MPKPSISQPAPWIPISPARAQGADARVAKTRKRTVEDAGAVRTPISVRAAYHKRLLQLIKEMHNSVEYWLGARFKQVAPQRELLSPTMALDATAAEELQTALNKLNKRWQSRFDRLAEDLAKFFGTKMAERSDAELKRILRKGGMSIKFQMTPAMKEAVSAIVHENVSLIKSIPEQYLKQVEGATMRSVLAGRGLQSLYEDIRKNYNVSKRRAELISRDQANKATAMLSRVRYQEAGIRQAVWVHSHAGREPRPSHVKAGRDKVVFSVDEGWYDPHEQKYILPGQLINCRCIMRPLLPSH